MLNRDRVKELVILEVKKYIAKGIEVEEQAKIVEDLKITGDDDSFLIKALEKKSGMNASYEEWENVVTIGDAIDLITKHLS